jgi:hypothetical protein
MSRAGYPNDWDFSLADSDNTRAIGFGAADGNLAGLPEAVTAFIPHSDDYALICSKNTTWVLRGDPATGGVIDNLSHTVGCISRFGWAQDPQGGVYMLTNNGIYYQARGADVAPYRLSKQMLPTSMLTVDLQVIEPFLIYDTLRDGLWIYLAPKSLRPMQAWFFDIETGGFFSIDYPVQNHHPRTVYHYRPEAQAFTKVLLGGNDGYIRAVGGSDDDTVPIYSSALIGPLSLGVPGGFVRSLQGTLDSISGDVNWSVSVGNDAESAAYAVPLASGTWSGGYNNFVRPELAGRVAYISLTSNAQWAMETIDVATDVARDHVPL